MMPRTFAALATILFSAQAFAQEEDVPVAEETTPEVEAEEEYAEEEEYVEEEGEFCGGGEETVVDYAYYEIEAGNFAEARRMLVEGLRTGAIERWQRPYALATLAEAQLRLGQYGLAIINYRKALRLDPDSSSNLHVGLATALYMRGMREQARAQAELARDALCGETWSQVACFAAQAVISRTAIEESERDAASQAMQTIRQTQTDSTAQLDEAEQRLERRGRS